jgi:hypothetical protein
MNHVTQDFADLLHALLDHEVPFVVFGAQAVIAHGVSDRVTGDLDVYVKPGPHIAPRVLAVLRQIYYPPHTVGADLEVFSRPGEGIWMGLEPQRIDLHTELLGITDPLESTVTLEVHGVPSPVLSIPVLIASKLASGRDKDLEDVAALRRLQGAGA